MMTTKDGERLRAIERVFRSEVKLRDLIGVLPRRLADEIDLPRIEQTLREETAGLGKEHERLDAMARAETPDPTAQRALVLHQASVGSEKLRGQAIVIPERREGTAAEQNAALARMEDELHEEGHFWGSDANAIVIVGGEECEHDASAVIAASVMADDDMPHAALLVDRTRDGVARCAFQGTSDMEVGARVRYSLGKRWDGEQERADQGES